jgi:hypothetical protein
MRAWEALALENATDAGLASNVDDIACWTSLREGWMCMLNFVLIVSDLN